MSDENENEDLDDSSEPTLEDSMVIPDFSPPVRGKLLSNVMHDVSSALSQLINLNPDNVYHEPTCTICNNPHRSDLEEKWEETKNYSEVKAIMKAKAGLSLTDEAIDNHIINHLSRGVKELQKIEYLNKINRLSGTNITSMDRIHMGLSALTIRLMELSSLTPNTSTSAIDVERLKCAETARLLTVYNQLIKMQTGILGEMKTDGEIISIPSQRFVDAFNETILNAKTDGERNLIKDLLVKLTDLSKFAQ